MLTLHNTLTRQKEPFAPRDANRITMYVCGPTVYDFAHIGNARPVVVFDVLYRLLKHLYPDARVEYARNITDVDDKINARAQELVAENPKLAINDAIGQITQKFEKHYNDDMAALGCLLPDHTPRATAHIPQMIAMIETLIARDHAYEEQGHVLFHVPSITNFSGGYGKLSGRNREEQIAGARVEVAPYKRDPADFVLWKPSTDDLPGWDSPWGRGRPGWHIECSAMSRAVLGEQIDIHGGGLDLIFPHHENEIAQSECSMCSGMPYDPIPNLPNDHSDNRRFSRYWLHNGYLTVNGEKMSKSLGNFFTVRDVLAKYPGEVIRYAMLKTHYRSPIDWTDSLLEESKKELIRLYSALSSVSDVENLDDVDFDKSDIFACLYNDLNTPQLLVVMRHYAEQIFLNQHSSNHRILREFRSKILFAAKILGLLDLIKWMNGLEACNHILKYGVVDTTKIDQLIQDRQSAKTAKDYKRADAIRAELDAMGIVLEDKPGGVTEWRRK